MAGPWEKYAQKPTARGPWEKYGQQQQGGSPRVIETTQDGGKIMQAADGSLSFSSPGYSTNNPDRIAEIRKGAKPVDLVQGDLDRERIAANPVSARVQEFNQGFPVLGEWADEAVGVVAPKAADNMRKASDAMERQHPGQSAALNIAGGVGYGGALLSAAAGATPAPTARWIGSAATKAGTLGRAAAVAAPMAAVEGAAAFSGRASGDDRVKAGAQGALVGGTLGGVIGAFAPLAVAGVANLAKRVKGLDVKTIADEFGVSIQAARIARRALSNDDLVAARAVLYRGGEDVMLAEAGPATRNIVDSAMQTGGAALAAGRKAVASRVKGQADKFSTVLNTVLGTAEGGIKGAVSRMSKASAEARRQAYDYAYGQPTPMTGKVGADLEAALERVPPKVMSRAVEEANDMMRDAGLKNQNIMASIDDATGEVVFSQPLSVAQLDYVARGLGEIAEKESDKLTGSVSGAGMRAGNQAKAIRDALKDGVDGYADALKLGGDNIANRNALVMGRKLLSEVTTVEDVRKTMSGASNTAKAAAKKGLRENIEALMGRARATIDDLESGNMDFDTGVNKVGEAVAALRALSTKNNFQKMRLVLGADAKKLTDELERMGDVLVLRAAVARNSATAIRTATREEMDAVTRPGLARRTIGEMGNPFDGIQELSRTAAGTDAAAISDRQVGFYAELAKALTNIKGKDARRALAAARKAMNGQPMKDADAALIGRLTGVNLSNLAYQGARQSPMLR